MHFRSVLKLSESGDLSANDTSQGNVDSPSGSSPMSRLSEADRALQAQGIRNLPWKVSEGETAIFPLLDIDWLTSQPLLPFLVEVANPSLLYRSLVHHGLQDSVEVIEWLRGEQLQRVLDFDLWSKPTSPDVPTDISAEKFFEWLRVWFDVSPEFAAERVLELDEEYITLIFSKILDIQPIGVSSITQYELEEFWRTNDDRYLLKVKSDDNEAFELMHQLIESMYHRDVRMAQSVLAYSAMLIRQESLEDGLRWRAGRLADAGFVSPEEARVTLSFRGIEKVKNDIAKALEFEKKRQQALEISRLKSGAELPSSQPEIIPEVLDAVVKIFEKMEPEKCLYEVERLLGTEELRLLSGSAQPVAEYISEDLEVLHEAAERVIHKCQKLLSLVDVIPLRQTHTESLIIEQGLAFMAQNNPESASTYKGRISRVANTIAAALSNYFDNDLLQKSVLVARGAINVGLEKMMSQPQDFGFVFEGETASQRASELIQAVGPEFLFQLGWNEMLEVTQAIVDKLKALSESDAKFLFLSHQVKISFTDGSDSSYGIGKLFQAQRFVELRRWLFGLESHLNAGAFVVLGAIINRIPFYPDILNGDNNDPHKGSRKLKPFEHMSEIQSAHLFVENLAHILL